MTKLCGKCQMRKEFEEFSKRTYSSGNIGYQPWCKSCLKIFGGSWVKNKRKSDPIWAEAERLTQKVRREKLPQEVKETRLAKNRAYHKNYYLRNKSYYTEKWLARELHQKQATPSWLSDFDKQRITLIYKIRDLLKEKTSESWHVDHVIPLRGKNVCGLHVPSNLRVIKAKENLSKGNSYEQRL